MALGARWLHWYLRAHDKLRFDHVVHNDQVERAVAELLSTLERELDA